ncbi:restriction endonuclease subunit S [Streptomyces sp. NBC_00996]|uniref:restriction endonuclease subunit S n=1 Tax=Streptomyces sp. NBC_00996 TaxID=2903710 RepID=UPI003862E840|nr:hypothetical protein OG390_18955 [Streptomyces sp. NBC_00996]
MSENGFGGVVDGWVENVDTMLSPQQDARTKKLRTRTAAERRQAYDHKAVGAIAPRFLEELAEADARKAEGDARFKELSARLSGSGEEPEADGDSSDGEDESEEVVLTVEELAQLTAELAKVKKARTKAAAGIKRLEADFHRYPYPSDPPTLGEEPPGLFRAREELDAEGERRDQVNVNPSRLRELEIHLPADLAEQRRIVATLEACDEQIGRENSELNKLRELMLGLVDDLLSGQVAVAAVAA